MIYQHLFIYLLQIGARKHQVNTAESKLRNANENVDRYTKMEFQEQFF